jgi:hypothetical protein
VLGKEPFWPEHFGIFPFGWIIKYTSIEEKILVSISVKDQRQRRKLTHNSAQ